MIVKNERPVIKRCLASVKRLIDYWVIVDTGSTDGTQDVIREYMRDIPGEIYERPWVDFGHNRNEALDLARNKSEYILFMDADDRLVFDKSFTLPKLDKDFYVVMQQTTTGNAHSKCPILFMIKDLSDFTWTGALHEVVTSPRMQSHSYEILTGVINEYLHDGARSRDPNSVAKDIHMLENALAKDPKNQMNSFYLARAYRTLEKYEPALRYFEKAAALEGRKDISFISQYCVGLLQEKLHYPPEVFLKTHYRAFLHSPFRSESLYEMARYYLQRENDYLAYLLSQFALAIPLPPAVEQLVETWLYEWGILGQFFTCAMRMGNYNQAVEAGRKLLANPHVPDSARKEIQYQLQQLEKTCARKRPSA